MVKDRPRGWFLVVFGMAGAAGAATLDLATALRIADSAGFGNRMARERRMSESGRNLSAWAGLLPSVRLEGAAAVTDDPMGAFGSTLGQRRVSAASFDPSALNEPDAVPGWTASVIAEVPIVNLDAWHGKVAAARGLRAAESAVRLEASRTRSQVVEAWFAVGLARAALETWEAGLAVARSYESQAASGHRNETVTRSDVLRSRVEVASIEWSLAKARADLGLAEKKLASLLGAGTLPGVVPRVELSDSVLSLHGRTADGGGASLESRLVGLQTDAARADWRRRGGALLPRLNGMARVDWKDRATPLGDDPSWTVGLVASWEVFGGVGSLGAEREARWRWREAETGLEALRIREELELEAEQARLDAAMERLEIGRGALEQAVESHRIASRRYEEGLSTIAERIEVGSLETRIRLEMVASRQDVVSALARIALLQGRDPEELVPLARGN